MAVAEEIQRLKDDPLYYHNPIVARHRTMVEGWPTFRDLVNIMHDNPADYRSPFIIEGLLHLGRLEAAQVLAITALAIGPPSIHPDIQLALQRKWMDQSDYSPNPERDLKLALWIERERLYPTWT